MLQRVDQPLMCKGSLANRWVKCAVRRIQRFALVRADAFGAANPSSAEYAADGGAADLRRQ
jgi:hypothetical protein